MNKIRRLNNIFLIIPPHYVNVLGGTITKLEFRIPAFSPGSNE
jgi:hypothetical protein